MKEMAKANLQAEQADLDFALINLYAEIASSYLELREAQTRNAVLLNNISGNKQTLQFIKSRYKAGYASYLNVSQQDGLVETQSAELEQNKAYITALLHKIELLTGNNPGVLAKNYYLLNQFLKSLKILIWEFLLNFYVGDPILERRNDG